MRYQLTEQHQSPKKIAYSILFYAETHKFDLFLGKKIRLVGSQIAITEV